MFGLLLVPKHLAQPILHILRIYIYIYIYIYMFAFLPRAYRENNATLQLCVIVVSPGCAVCIMTHCCDPKVIFCRLCKCH